MTTRPAGLDTRRLAPTGLAELDAAAGLLVRVDRKYLVPLATAQGLVDALAGAARVLQIEGRRGFSYASTYFDTPDLDSYLLAPASGGAASRSAPAATSTPAPASWRSRPAGRAGPPSSAASSARRSTPAASPRRAATSSPPAWPTTSPRRSGRGAWPRPWSPS